MENITEPIDEEMNVWSESDIDRSILLCVKQSIGFTPDYKAFDSNIIMLINSSLARLRQIGVDVKKGFLVYDEIQTWDDICEEDIDHSFIKPYVFMKTKLVFDPPASSTAMQQMQEALKELEFSIMIDFDKPIKEEGDNDE